MESLYSSVSKHLDVLYKGKAKDNEYASSIFSIVTDAIENSSLLTHERLFDWQKRLFLHKAGIKPRHLGEYRKRSEYVLRTSGKEADIIYTAVPSSFVYQEMEKFLAFVNCNNDMNPFIKAAIASLWFVLIHPFEDGNGRISRCIADYIINNGTNDGFRTFSISSTILKKKKEYYEEIQKLAVGISFDVTSWIEWFLNIVTDSIKESRALLKKTLAVTAFMKRLDPKEFNSREMSMLYRLADGSFYGKLTTDKWMKLMKCSNTVAFRDIRHLVEKGFLIPSGEGGRSTGYFFNDNILDS